MLEIYGAGWCVPCSNAKKFLDRNNVEYDYKDIEEDQEALTYIKSLGYSGVPVFQLGEEHWQGFDLKKLKELV